MDWVEDRELLYGLTYEEAVDDLMSCLDMPHDCLYSFNELADILAEHFEVPQAKIRGAATFGLADLKAEREELSD